MKVRWQDGFVAEGTAAEIVDASRGDAWFPEASVEDWMLEVAYRSLLYAPDARLRYDTPEHFLADQIAAGLVEVLSNGMGEN